MGLNTRSLFDPRWQQALGLTNNRAQTSSVLIRRPKSKNAVAPSTWSYEQGKYVGGSDYTTIWTGPAKIQPDKDWRARGYEFGGESTVFQAVNFALPLAGGNWATGLPNDMKDILDEDQILITSNYFKGIEPILKYVFVVRNPIQSGVEPIRNVLCDVNLKGGLSR